MKNDMHSVEQVAGALDLHPRTIRRFIKEGKIHARKLGGQWRISEQDLRAFVGEDTTTHSSPSAELEGGQDGVRRKLSSKVYVSSVVDIFVEDAEEAMRISNSISAVMNAKDPMYGATRCDHVFYKDELKARFVLWGKPLFISRLLGLIAEISE